MAPTARRFVTGVHLKRTSESVDEIAALHAAVGGPVGVDGVLDDPDRQAHSARVPGRAVSHGFAWAPRDAGTVRWWPQGVTTSADASDTEDVAGRSVVVTSWYSRELHHLHQGSRLTFVDLATLRYRHVLLVRAVVRDGRVDLEPLKTHAGGIVWAGPYLHVAGTGKGIATARLDDLVRLPAALYDDDHHHIGRRPGSDRLAAFGYRYVLPVRFSYRAHSDDGVPRLRYSFVSLDRRPGDPHLVVGEYGRGGQTTRLVRFPLDPRTHHLIDGDDGFARPVELDEHGEARMQGAAVVGDTWYLTSSRGQLGRSSMYVGRPGAFVELRRALPMGCEDLAYWPSRDEFWSLAEHPGRRWVFAVPRSRLAR